VQFYGLGDWQTHILYDYTTSGHKGTTECICNVYIYTVHINLYTIYLFTYLSCITNVRDAIMYIY
jgi:hypothetical protein